MATAKKSTIPTSAEINSAVEAYRKNAKRGAVTTVARRIAGDPRFLISVSPSQSIADAAENRSAQDPTSIPLLKIVN